MTRDGVDHLRDDHCTMVIFGGSGDLARRKLVPALYNLYRENKLPKNFSLLGVGRKEISCDQYREDLAAAVASYSSDSWDVEKWNLLAAKIDYLSSDVEDPDSYRAIKNFIAKHTENNGKKHNYLYYLAVAPRLFLPIARNFSEPISDQQTMGWRRIMVEKPFGSNLQTAQELNKALCASFNDQNIYRIDHYLGKEMLQNIMVIRFINTVFEPLWNHRYIDNIQVTVAENEGIVNRGDYYDHAGAMRDMVQSHLLQMLAVAVMEPPSGLEPESVVHEKLKVIRALRLWSASKQQHRVILGQYSSYRSEQNVNPDSLTETYAAIKMAVDLPRWQGVPFFLRTGKMLPEKQARITIQFKRPLTAHSAVIQTGLGVADSDLLNLLILKVQPKEGVAFQFNIKKPASINEIVPATMDFCQPCAFLINTPEAYERLIADAISGDKTRFSSWEEIETSWALIDSIYRNNRPEAEGSFFYEPSSWGPVNAEMMPFVEGTKWWS